ncbi:MAG TPA: hypothetical protein VFK38_05385 [Candidatus Limnocylindrales bacterium]|nr:hypothetical protein [Candidatus Limnocylindrales bacterium]
MKTRPAALSVPIFLALTLAACAGAPPSPTPLPSTPPARDLPGVIGGSSVDPNTPIAGGGGGSMPSNPGDPGLGQPQLVVPKPGQKAVHPVAVTRLEPRIDAGRVIVRATWTSGVEPCNVLDSVDVQRAGSNVTLTVREGTGQGDAVCIEIAVQKATDVDLGVLPAGTYTIQTSHGDAAAVQITVP